MSDDRQAKLALKLVADDLPRIAEVQRRLAETTPVVRAEGRKFKDEDPKRGAQSPLGGRIW